MTTNTEPRIDRGRLYEGLDAQHTPRLIVPEQYIEQRSGKLQRLAGQALLSAQLFPEKQFDVVWLGSRPSRLLRADTQPTGSFGHSFGYFVEGDNNFFLPDPGRIMRGDREFTYLGRVEDALKNGAQVFKPADLAPRNQP